MKNFALRISFLTIICLFTVTAYAQQEFPYHLYEPRTIGEFDEIHSDVKDMDYGSITPIMISAKPFYSAVRVEYVGKSRKIPKGKLTLFKIWQESLNINADVLERLDDEYLFKECNNEYWIPVQKQVASFFSKELKDGDLITIYIMAVGGVKPDDKWEFVFVANEFQKY